MPGAQFISPTKYANREWVIEPPHPLRAKIADEAGIHPLLAQVLLIRGVDSAAGIHPFLNPEFRSLHSPDLLPGAALAADRLVAAISENKRIIIYGDYDVDGITAAAILWHGLKLAGANVDFYVPSRFEEGYGLNADALERLAADGANIVITVDCGITAVKEAARARELGLEIIITDHHQPGPTLPDASIIVHPSLNLSAYAPDALPRCLVASVPSPDSCIPSVPSCLRAFVPTSPNPDLSGAGVALKIAWALAVRVSGNTKVTQAFRDYLLDATALAALGLIADVVPLTGENRIIASFGLRHLRHTQNPGLQALIEVAGLTNKATNYDDYDVGFALAPRLNAIGRMGHARLAVEMFTRAGVEEARQIALTLDGHNKKRQSVEREIAKHAEALVIERGFDRAGCHAIVLASPDWHAGVIGIVASRMVERFGRPTVLIALEAGKSAEFGSVPGPAEAVSRSVPAPYATSCIGQGSGRSIRHFPLHEVLAACSQHLISHGGHAMAAGLKIAADNVDAFTEAFLAQAAQRLTPTDLLPRLMLDDEVHLDDLQTDVVDQLGRMAPFGAGNARPRLCTMLVQLADKPRAVGQNGNHLQFVVRQGKAHRKAIAFNRGSQLQELSETNTLRIAFEPLINDWNGRRSVELKVLDWKAADA